MFFKKFKMKEAKLKLRETKVSELLDSMLESNVEIHFAPLSSEFLIVDKENSISICLNDSFIKVANHSYLYEIGISGNTSTKYMKKVKAKIQEQVNGIKKELFKNEIELLDNIKQLYT